MQPQQQPQPIETSSLHEVNVWKQEQQRQKRLKHCQNLIIGSITQWYGGQNKTQKFFFPKCTAHSFDFGRRLIVHEQEEAEYLINNLHHDPITCPANCTLYQPLWKQNATKPLTWTVKRTKQVIDYFFVTIDKTTRVLIIVLLIVVFGTSKITDGVVKILNAAFGHPAESQSSSKPAKN